LRHGSLARLTWEFGLWQFLRKREAAREQTAESVSWAAKA
jgi:hypothetical protein